MKRWVRKQCRANLKMVADRYHISEIFAEVLVNRGLYDWEQMDRYLFPDLEAMYPPEDMKDLVKAARRLQRAIDENEEILVIGDYDVDGVLSSYILVKGIRMLGGHAGYRIPHRVKDGYGIRAYMAEEAYEQGIRLLITCDNGISAWDAVKRAKELGMDIIVTDHHEVPVVDGREQLPPADAVVDPKQEGCGYPCPFLCGAGVAYKLMQYLYSQKSMEDELSGLLPFAAVATVCDVVPLTDENRIIVSNGLKLLSEQKKCQNVGLRALIDALHIENKINAGHLGFRVGPSLNAAGRLEDAARGMELLLEENRARADIIAGRLVALNEERKELTGQAAEKAVQQIEEEEMLRYPVLVVCLEDCHESIAGIVAGRIREKYYRPTLILTKGERSLKGSGRSIPEYHMQKALTQIKELLVEFGGHAMAAGFSVLPENLNAVREALNEKCTLRPEEMVEKVLFDCEVPLREMSPELVSQLGWMEPAGEGNPGALFAVCGLTVVSCYMCGKEKQIARLRVREEEAVYEMVDFQAENHLGKAVCERYGRQAWDNMKNGVCGLKLDVLYRPDINDRYGTLQFIVEDCR